MLVCCMERLAMMAMDYGIKIEFNIRLINLLTDNALFVKATLDFGEFLIRFCNNGTKIHSTGLDAKESVSLECLDLSVNTVVCFICKSGNQKFCHGKYPFVFVRP